MIEKTILYYETAPPPQSGKILRMVQNDRMAGSVPKWEDAPAALAALAPQSGAPADFATALAEQAKPPEPSSAVRPQPQPFGFGDLLDIVNPLQHIPLVGHVYREVTGDEIQPIGRLIGGTVFGGPIGAVLSAANVIVEQETGKDMTGNALALAFKGDMPARISTETALRPKDPPHENQFSVMQDDPQTRLNAVLTRRDSLAALEGTTLAFADLRASAPLQTAQEGVTQAAPSMRKPHYNE